MIISIFKFKSENKHKSVRYQGINNKYITTTFEYNEENFFLVDKRFRIKYNIIIMTIMYNKKTVII